MTSANEHNQAGSALLKFLYPEIIEDQSREQEIFEEAGLNYDELSKQGIEFVRELARKEMKVIAKRKREKFNSILQALQGIKNVSDSLRARLDKIGSSEPAGIQLAFHKFESLSNEDINSILTDIEALKAIEKSANDSMTSGD